MPELVLEVADGRWVVAAAVPLARAAAAAEVVAFLVFMDAEPPAVVVVAVAGSILLPMLFDPDIARGMVLAAVVVALVVCK